METQTILLIISNIIVPIIVAIITGMFQNKKYKKEIQLLKLEHQNKEKSASEDFGRRLQLVEIKYKNEIDKLNMQIQYAKEAEQQKAETQISSMLIEKLSDEIVKQPATQKLINQQTTKQFLNNKTGRKRR